MPSRRALLPLAVLLAGVAGCYASDDCYPCESNPRVLYEVEPNDSSAYPNVVGGIGPGDQVLIHGHVTQWGPDLFDGFAFHTETALDLELLLWIDDPSVDLDLCVYDPDLGQYATCFETSSNPETGYLSIAEAGKPFHLVVSSFFGASSYTLEVRGLPLASYDSGVPGTAGASPTPADAREHRPGTEERWEGYVRPGPAEGSEEARTVGLPGRLITVELESGRVRSQPVQVVPLGRD